MSDLSQKHYDGLKSMHQKAKAEGRAGITEEFQVIDPVTLQPRHLTGLELDYIRGEHHHLQAGQKVPAAQVIWPMPRPTHASQLAKEIVHLRRDMGRLERKSMTVEEARTENLWESRVLELCEQYMQDQDRVIAYLQKSLTEAVNVMIKPVFITGGKDLGSIPPDKQNHSK